MGAKEWEVWRSRWEKGWAGKKEKIEEKQQKGEANDKRQGKGWPVERVVGTSKFQITKPDALFVVFLGIKWAYDFLKKNRS